MVSNTACIFHMLIPCGKTFSLPPRVRSRSNIKIKFFIKCLLWRHSCFTNTSYLFFLLIKIEFSGRPKREIGSAATDEEISQIGDLQSEVSVDFKIIQMASVDQDQTAYYMHSDL